jgi:hypothetical protein
MLKLEHVKFVMVSERNKACPLQPQGCESVRHTEHIFSLAAAQCAIPYAQNVALQVILHRQTLEICDVFIG